LQRKLKSDGTIFVSIPIRQRAIILSLEPSVNQQLAVVVTFNTSVRKQTRNQLFESFNTARLLHFIFLLVSWLLEVVKVLLEDGGKGGDRTSLEKLTHQRSGRSKRTNGGTAVGTPAAVSVVVTVVLVPIRAHVGHRVGDAGRGVRRRLHGLTLSDRLAGIKELF